MFELIEHLSLDTDLPKCSISVKDSQEQHIIIELMNNPYLPPIIHFKIEEGY